MTHYNPSETSVCQYPRQWMEEQAKFQVILVMHKVYIYTVQYYDAYLILEIDG